MKTKIIYSTLLLLTFITWSCNDFLDEVNKTDKTDEIVYSNEKSLVGLLGSCYSYLKLWYGKEAGFGLSEAGTDLWYNARDNAQTELVTYSGITPELSTAVFNEYWDGFYAGINACNLTDRLISNMDIPDERKNPYLAEARFLRAFYYWHLVEIWGECQILIAPQDSISSKGVRDSTDAIYRQMFKDVQFAIDNLPSGSKPSARVTHWAAKAFKARLALYYASEYGKSEYYTIAAETAKNIIDNCPDKGLYDNYADVWKIANNNTINNKEFIWAVDYYDEISTSITYNNLPTKPGGGNWHGLIARRQTTESGGSGGNISHLLVTPLWNTQSDAVGGPSVADVLRRLLGPNAGFYTISSPTVASTAANPFDPGYWYAPYSMGYTRYAPTRYCLDLFDETLDQRWNVSFRTAWYKHPKVVPRNYGLPTCAYPNMSVDTQTDTSLYYSKKPLTVEQKAWASTRYKALDVTNTFESDGFTPNASSGLTGANQMYVMLRKFENTDSKIAYGPANFNDYFSYRDFPVFRISEMYLIAAEAQISSNQSDAMALINTLRVKRALPGKAADMEVTSVDLNLILEERAREFAGENIRWFDLKRTKKLKDQLIHNTKAYNNFNENKHYLRPIPASMINSVTNRTPGPDPNGFWQNPGY